MSASPSRILHQTRQSRSNPPGTHESYPSSEDERNGDTRDRNQATTASAPDPNNLYSSASDNDSENPRRHKARPSSNKSPKKSVQPKKSTQPRKSALPPAPPASPEIKSPVQSKLNLNDYYQDEEAADDKGHTQDEQLTSVRSNAIIPIPDGHPPESKSVKSQAGFSNADWLARLEQLLIHFFLIIFDSSSDFGKMIMEMFPLEASTQIEEIFRLLLEADTEMYKNIGHLVGLAENWLLLWNGEVAKKKEVLDYIRLYMIGCKNRDYYNMPIHRRLKKLGAFIAGLKKFSPKNIEFEQLELPGPDPHTREEWTIRAVSPRVKAASHYARVVATILCDRSCAEPLPQPNVYADSVTKAIVPSNLTKETELSSLTDYRYGSQYHKKDLFQFDEEQAAAWRSRMLQDAKNTKCCLPLYTSEYTKIMESIYNSKGKHKPWKECLTFTGYGPNKTHGYRSHRPESAEFEPEYEVEYEYEYEPDYEYEYEVELDENGMPKLGPDGKPILKLDAYGQPIPILGADGRPVPKLGADGKKILKLDAYGQPIPMLGADGRPLPKLGADGKKIFKLDAYGQPIPILGADGRPVPKLGADGKKIFKLDAYGNPIYKRDASGKLVKQRELNDRVPDVFAKRTEQIERRKRQEAEKQEALKHAHHAGDIAKQQERRKHQFEEKAKERAMERKMLKAAEQERERIFREEEEERERRRKVEEEEKAELERKKAGAYHMNGERRKSSFGQNKNGKLGGVFNRGGAFSKNNYGQYGANKNDRKTPNLLNKFQLGQEAGTETSKSGAQRQPNERPKPKARQKPDDALIGDYKSKRTTNRLPNRGPIPKDTSKALKQTNRQGPTIGYAMVGEVGPIPLGLSRKGSKAELFDEYPGEYERTMDLMFSHNVLKDKNSQNNNKRLNKWKTGAGDTRAKGKFQSVKNNSFSEKQSKKSHDGVVDILKGIEVKKEEFGVVNKEPLPTLHKSQKSSKADMKNGSKSIVISNTSIKSHVDPQLKKISQIKLEEIQYEEQKLHGKLSKTFFSKTEVTGPTSVRSLGGISITNEEKIEHTPSKTRLSTKKEIPSSNHASKNSINNQRLSSLVEQQQRQSMTKEQPAQNHLSSNKLRNDTKKVLPSNYQSKVSMKSNLTNKSVKSQALNEPQQKRQQPLRNNMQALKQTKFQVAEKSARHDYHNQQQNQFKTFRAVPHYPARNNYKVILPPLPKSANNTGTDDNENQQFFPLSRLDKTKNKNELLPSGESGTTIHEQGDAPRTPGSINANWELAADLFRRPLRAIAIPPPENILAYIKDIYSSEKWPSGPPLAIRTYPNGDVFCATYKNGSGQVFYPHGGLAIVISAPTPVNHVLVIRDPYDEFYFLDKSILADLDCSGDGVVYGKEDSILMRYNKVGGYRLDPSDKTLHKWLWNRGGQRMIQKMNRYMSLRVLDLSQIHLVFNGNKRGLRFNVGPGRNISLIYISSILENESLDASSYSVNNLGSPDRFDYRRARFPTPVLGFFDRCRYSAANSPRPYSSEMRFKFRFEDCDFPDFEVCECVQ